MQPISSHLQLTIVHLKPDWRTVETDCWLSTKQAGSLTHFLKSGGTLSKAHPALKLISLRIIFLKTFLTCDLLRKLCTYLCLHLSCISQKCCICAFVHLLADGAGLWPSGPWITPHPPSQNTSYTPFHTYRTPQPPTRAPYTFLRNTSFLLTLVLLNITFLLHSTLQSHLVDLHVLRWCSSRVTLQDPQPLYGRGPLTTGWRTIETMPAQIWPYGGGGKSNKCNQYKCGSQYPLYERDAYWQKANIVKKKYGCMYNGQGCPNIAEFGFFCFPHWVLSVWTFFASFLPQIYDNICVNISVNKCLKKKFCPCGHCKIHDTAV